MVQTNDTTMKTAFARQRENRVDKVMEEAQRLVNLYHHVESFDTSFSTELDQMIKAISPEVQAALSGILGGTVVRQYYEFLTGRKDDNNSTDTDSETTEDTPQMMSQVGYLPSPEEDEIVSAAAWTPAVRDGNTAALESAFKHLVQANRAELERLLQAQTDTLAQVLQRLDQQTHEVATHQTDRLIHAIKQEAGKSTAYSDVIESADQTPVLVPDDMEGF